jgi:ribokinase
MSVLVFGSINMDLVARTPHLPQPGETLTGHSFETVPGGKGANQAVAVARLGVPVELVGRLGGDEFGVTLQAGLQQDGVGGDRLRIDDDTHSGVALIAVEEAGENHIIVIPGANGRVDQTDVERLQAAFAHNQLLLLQLEIPLDAVVAAAQAAQRAGLTVILDPAPARSDLPAALYPAVDILTPNQVEAAQLAGVPVTDPDSAAEAAAILQARGVRIVIVKLGQQGAFCATPETRFHLPAMPVTAVDTVAAGDAFNGGLAAALAEGLDLPAAAQQATAVAALAVTQPGAQPALPTRDQLEDFLSP